MAKEFFVNVFFDIANVDFLCYMRYVLMLHMLFLNVAKKFTCCKKIYILHATFMHVATGIFNTKLPFDARGSDVRVRALVVPIYILSQLNII